MLGFGEQRGENIAIVDRVDETEKAAAVVEFGDMRAIDGRDDPANRFAVAKRDKRLNHVLPHERRSPGIEQHPDFVLDRLDPMRVNRLCAPAGGNESGDPGAVRDRINAQLAHGPAVPRANAVLAAASSSTMMGTEPSISSGACSLLKKKRRRASRSGIAG